MSYEYVKFSVPEVMYSRKNLLQSQIGLLNLAKSCEEYRKLRKDELALKIVLKTKLDELKNSLGILNSLLPKIKIGSQSFLENSREIEATRKKRLSLEQEIDLIKKKLATLH